MRGCGSEVVIVSFPDGTVSVGWVFTARCAARLCSYTTSMLSTLQYGQICGRLRHRASRSSIPNSPLQSELRVISIRASIWIMSHCSLNDTWCPKVPRCLKYISASSPPAGLARASARHRACFALWKELLGERRFQMQYLPPNDPKRESVSGLETVGLFPQYAHKETIPIGFGVTTPSLICGVCD
jgi:hypothetical protein